VKFNGKICAELIAYTGNTIQVIKASTKKLNIKMNLKK
jgi:hypothetical protein